MTERQFIEQEITARTQSLLHWIRLIADSIETLQRRLAEIDKETTSTEEPK